MLKRILAGLLVSAFIWLPSLSIAKETLELSEIIDEARRNNPEILASFKRYAAAKARIPQASSLDDPAIGFKFEKIPRGTLKLDKTPTIDRMFSITQALPFFGKLPLKGKIALVESQMLAAEYKSRELEIVAQVKKAYYELFMKEKDIGLSRNSLDFLEAVARSAEAKYVVGDIPQEDVLKIHSEIARLNVDILNLEQQKRAVQTRLNSLLNREPEASLADPVLNEELSFDRDMDSLYKLTIENQPELLVFSYAIERNRYAKSLAQKSFFPDFVAGIIQRGIASGTLGPWDLMLSLTVPLWFWTKQRYQIKEAINNLEEAEAAYEAMKNKALSETKNLAVAVRTQKNTALLYKNELIPLLESSIESSLASLRSGAGDFMMLLDSERMLIETKREYYRAVVEYNTNLAELERNVGTELSGVKNEE